MKSLITRFSMVATRMTILCTVMSIAALAWAQTDNSSQSDDQGTCSNRTLRGDYGELVSDGVLIGVPGLPQEAQFRTVGLYHFNGKGKVTGLEHTVVNGQSLPGDWTPNSGTYSVNSNCTGTMVINTPNNPFPLNIFFVVVAEGSEIRTVLDTNAVAGTFRKVE